MKNRESQVQTSFRLSKTGFDILQRLSREWGIGRKGVVELLLREAAYDRKRQVGPSFDYKGYSKAFIAYTDKRELDDREQAGRSPGRQKSRRINPANPAGSGKDSRKKG